MGAQKRNEGERGTNKAGREAAHNVLVCAFASTPAGRQTSGTCANNARKQSETKKKEKGKRKKKRKNEGTKKEGKRCGGRNRSGRGPVLTVLGTLGPAAAPPSAMASGGQARAVGLWDFLQVQRVVLLCPLKIFVSSFLFRFEAAQLGAAFSVAIAARALVGAACRARLRQGAAYVRQAAADVANTHSIFCVAQ